MQEGWIGEDVSLAQNVISVGIGIRFDPGVWFSFAALTKTKLQGQNEFLYPRATKTYCREKGEKGYKTEDFYYESTRR